MTTRPRAADDFTAIRARVEELRRERDQIEAAKDGRSAIGPKQYHRAITTSDSLHRDDRQLSRLFRKFGR